MRRLLLPLAITGAIAGAWLTIPSPASAPALRPTPSAPAATAAPRSAGPSSAPQSPRPAEASLDALQAQIDALKAQRPPDEAPPADPLLEGDAWATAAVGNLESTLKAEPVDQPWRSFMEARVGAFFAEAERAGTHPSGLDCRKTLCSLSVRVDDLEARERLVSAASTLIEDDAEVFLHIEDDADLTIELYMTRMGTPLPLGDI